VDGGEGGFCCVVPWQGPVHGTGDGLALMRIVFLVLATCLLLVVATNWILIQGWREYREPNEGMEEGQVSRLESRHHPWRHRKIDWKTNPAQDAVERRRTTMQEKRRRPGQPKVAASITAFGRPLMFHRALMSFRLHCLDCLELVDQWFAIDDGSSMEQLQYMKRLAPDVQWIRKGPEERGLPGSLNVLVRVTRDYDYLVQIEDDFFYVMDERYVGKSLRILQSDPRIGQVLFNQNYAETNTAWETERLVGGISVTWENGDGSHIEHVYAGPVGSERWKEYFKDKPGKVGNLHWPHFSTRGGVWNLSAIRSVGQFENLEGSGVFEYAFAKRYVQQGYKSAFLPGVYSIHLGALKSKSIPVHEVEKMYQRYGLDHSSKSAKSAYSLT